jgi:outer membrane protein assembly factor BamB
MKRICVIAILTAVLCGCRRGEDHPAEPAETAQAQAQSQHVYLGGPLEHWTRLAEQAKTDKERATALDALSLAIVDSDVTAVVTAADAIETIGPKGAKAAPALASRLDDVQPWVRMACMEALQAIGEPAVPTLLETFRTGPDGARIRAAIVLGDIGPAAKSAVPELRRDLQEGPEARRSWVAEALAKIEGVVAGAASGEGTTHSEEIILPAPVMAVDERGWPRFLGPYSDNLCRETGLYTDWSQGPPALLWTIEGLGMGYSSVAITAGRIFMMGDREVGDGKKAQFVIAFDLNTQEELWAAEVGPPHTDGPRCTPTVDGDLVYAVGTEGDLVCLEAATGAERWRKSFVNDFGGAMMSGWRFSESPLVDGARLICTPGGKDATMVALDKRTGEVLWRCAVPALGAKGRDGAAYASPVPATIDGVAQYVQLIGRGVIGVEAETGRFLWGYNGIANNTANIPTPVVRGQYVFTTTGYGAGSAMLRVSRAGETFHVREMYTLTGRQFQNHHGGIASIGNHVYGGHGDNRGEPTCVDLTTGKIVWKGEALERGSAATLYADGHLWLRYDRGLVALVEATPEAFRLKGTFQPVTGSGPAWSRPVIHDGRLYLRHGDLLACYDVRRR